MIADIRDRLGIPDADVVHTGFYRPNLTLAVRRAAGDAEKRAALLEELRNRDGIGIVYAATVKAVDEVAGFLADAGLDVAAYHGRLSPKARDAAQDRFMAGGVKAMVATNAFGLGIDKPDIRFVVHYHLPGSVEAFYQEFGRSGRDGRPAVGLLLFDPADVKLQRFFGAGRYPDEGDLVNAYHAVGRLADGPEPPTLAEVLAISPLPKARLKVCLDLLVGRGVLRAEPGGQYGLVLRGLDRDQVAREGRAYRDRAERDVTKLATLVGYAEGKGCRWTAVLDYFGDQGTLPDGRCGHCDRCG
ncbi:MAG TPA: helicase-related protein [Urbifossiella sp.]|nr:helicase-related protein [Urbifossiella sp.]